MFQGAHYHSIDDRGRVTVPQRFRGELGNTFVITKGLDKCLFVYRENDFQEMKQQMMDQPELDRYTIRFHLWFSVEAVESQVDNQGRVAIPSNLREFAGIEEDVAIVGVGNRIEVWSRASWDAFNARARVTYVQVA